jgi:hypothetical protein
MQDTGDKFISSPRSQIEARNTRKTIFHSALGTLSP